MLIPEITQYIEIKKELKPEETTIHILVNDFTEIAIENIKKLAKNHKHIAIITKNISKMKNKSCIKKSKAYIYTICRDRHSFINSHRKESTNHILPLERSKFYCKVYQCKPAE